MNTASKAVKSVAPKNLMSSVRFHLPHATEMNLSPSGIASHSETLPRMDNSSSPFVHAPLAPAAVRGRRRLFLICKSIGLTLLTVSLCILFGLVLAYGLTWALWPDL